MHALLIAFLTSFFFTGFLVKKKGVHSTYFLDYQINGPQKFHTLPVPRIGGIGIFLGISCAIIFNDFYNGNTQNLIAILACSTLPFGAGLYEDLFKNLKIRSRLLIVAIGALAAYFLFDLSISRVGIPLLDFFLQLYPIGIIFTIFAVVGLTNSYNIIDGFHGLSSMVGIITLMAMGYIALRVADVPVMYACFVMSGSIMGFFLWNYPRGLIFLGDGGAYLIGFWISLMCLLLTSRHIEISPWFPIMVNAYPIVETLFSIYRRKFHQKKNISAADGIHFHSLIYRRVLRPKHFSRHAPDYFANALTSPRLWILSTLAVVPAIFFFKSTLALGISFALFSCFYIWIFRRIVTFRTPSWLHL